MSAQQNENELAKKRRSFGLPTHPHHQGTAKSLFSLCQLLNFFPRSHGPCQCRIGVPRIPRPVPLTKLECTGNGDVGNAWKISVLLQGMVCTPQLGEKNTRCDPSARRLEVSKASLSHKQWQSLKSLNTFQLRRYLADKTLHIRKLRLLHVLRKVLMESKPDFDGKENIFFYGKRSWHLR